MTYETPELTALSAINAIQNNNLQQKCRGGIHDNINPTSVCNEPGTGYCDWE